MLANHLYSLCQAVDLRALEHEFFDFLDRELVFPEFLSQSHVDVNAKKHELKELIHNKMSMDPEDRFRSALKAVISTSMETAIESCTDNPSVPLVTIWKDIQKWGHDQTDNLTKEWNRLLNQPDDHFTKRVSQTFPGATATVSLDLYQMIRGQLQVEIWRNQSNQNHGVDSQKILTAVRSGAFSSILKQRL